jgi:hypothetical protein
MERAMANLMVRGKGALRKAAEVCTSQAFNLRAGYPPSVEVGQEWGACASETSLVTWGANPCIIAVVHSVEFDKGGVAHVGVYPMNRPARWQRLARAIHKMVQWSGGGRHDILLHGGGREWLEPGSAWRQNSLTDYLCEYVRHNSRANVIDRLFLGVEPGHVLYLPSERIAYLLEYSNQTPNNELSEVRKAQVEKDPSDVYRFEVPLFPPVVS